jgi:hypothetical protein
MNISCNIYLFIYGRLPLLTLSSVAPVVVVVTTQGMSSPARVCHLFSTVTNTPDQLALTGYDAYTMPLRSRKARVVVYIPDGWSLCKVTTVNSIDNKIG